MIDLERMMEEIMIEKIDDALSRKNDIRKQMVLEENSFVPEIMAVPLPRASNNL